jgi:hypothetical protein
MFSLPYLKARTFFNFNELPLLLWSCYVFSFFRFSSFKMHVPIDELSAQIDALRQDYTFLAGFGVDASKVKDRSRVYQRTLVATKRIISSSL